VQLLPSYSLISPTAHAANLYSVIGYHRQYKNWSLRTLAGTTN